MLLCKICKMVSYDLFSLDYHNNLINIGFVYRKLLVGSLALVDCLSTCIGIFVCFTYFEKDLLKQKQRNDHLYSMNGDHIF